MFLILFRSDIKLLILPTSDPTSALAVDKPKASLEAAAVAITELTETVALEGRGGTLTTATRVSACTLITVITSHAVTVRPRARARTWVTPLWKDGNQNSSKGRLEVFVL